MRRILYGVIMATVAVMVVACGQSAAQKAGTEMAPDMTISALDGSTVHLSDYKGSVIILNFFGTWCPPCRREMPDFNDLAKEYPDDVQIIAVEVGGGTPEKVKAFADEYSLTFIVAVNDGQADKLFGPIRAIPVTIVIDKNFKIARKYIGARPREVLEQDIMDLR